MANTSKCDTCTMSRTCDTWGEIKCVKLKQRIYKPEKMTDCKFYTKRPKDFEEPKCQCEDCQKTADYDWELV